MQGDISFFVLSACMHGKHMGMQLMKPFFAFTQSASTPGDVFLPQSFSAELFFCR
jgi:hypothetical protein